MTTWSVGDRALTIVSHVSRDQAVSPLNLLSQTGLLFLPSHRSRHLTNLPPVGQKGILATVHNSRFSWPRLGIDLGHDHLQPDFTPV